MTTAPSHDITAQPARRLAGRRAALGVVIALIALGSAGCVVTAPAPVGPSMPMMSSRPAAPGVGTEEPDERGGPMMSARARTAPEPPGGALSGEGLDAAAVADLQAAVDRGSQPWRLDRVLVAEAYARGRLGMMMPSVRDTGTTVLVDGRGGGRAVLTLAQPGRSGPGGVWVVIGGSWVR